MDMPSSASPGLSGWGYTDFHASVNFAFWGFSEVAPDSVEWHHACGGRARPARDHTWGLGALTRKGGHVMEARTEADTFTMVALSRHRHRPPHANSPSLSW